MSTSKQYHNYVVETLSRVGDIRTRKMMGEYLIYYKEKLIGNICDDTLFLKQTKTSRNLLSDLELAYPYEGSKTLMYMLEEFENKDFIEELLEGMYVDLPKSKKKQMQKKSRVFTYIKENGVILSVNIRSEKNVSS